MNSSKKVEVTGIEAEYVRELTAEDLELIAGGAKVSTLAVSGGGRSGLGISGGGRSTLGISGGGRG
jgi:hypothetical protein